MIFKRAALAFAAVLSMGLGQNHGSTGSQATGYTPPVSTGTVSNFSVPAMGEFCPANGSVYDGANCYFGSAPPGTTAFIWGNGFYSTPLPGKQCKVGTYDGANCFLRPVPSAYSPFIYQNGWYTGRNPHYLVESTSCPSGYHYDGANCYYGTAAAGKKADVIAGVFYEVSTTTRIPTFKIIKTAPLGSGPFVYNNSWYIKPTKGGAGTWFVKNSIKDADTAAVPVCRSDVITPTRNWTLSWSDEFSDQPEGSQCYDTNDLLQCIWQVGWSSGNCGPTNWSSVARNTTWTTDQKNAFSGLVNLNKCHWKVYDSFNNWDIWNAGSTVGAMTNSFHPENVRIEGGVLKMFTKASAPQGGAYDCGRAYQAPGYTAYTSNCPYSGANIETSTGIPWTNGNSEYSSDPNRRFVGKAFKFGRIEVRAKIAHAGHGMWPALWMFADQVTDPKQGAAELDLLEYIADFDGATDQLTRQSITYATAGQTVHNWGVGDYPHVSQGAGIPISVGDWHVYSVEYEPTEIRFYIDNCLRNRVVEGQMVTVGNGKTLPFHIPTGQSLHMIIGNPASAVSYFPAWDQASGGTNHTQRPDFQPTELDVDYVRYYVDPGLGISKKDERSADRKIASVSSGDDGKAVHYPEQQKNPVANKRSWWKFW